MIEKSVNSLPIWFFESLLKHENISHFVSGRMGGFSSPPYDSLNLAFHVEDDPKKVHKNRQLLASTLDISLNNFTFAKQIHDSSVKIITEELRGSGGLEQQTAIEATDALVSNLSNICLIVLVADCVPILFFDPKKNVIGAAHAGWRGTVLGVVQNTVKTFLERFGSSPRDIIVGIGPSIGPCCYEVGSEVITHVEDTFHSKKGYIDEKPLEDGKGYLNLWETNKTLLVEMDIPENNIESAGICTHCNHNSFFSHRYQKSGTGRFGAGIMIKRV